MMLPYVRYPARHGIPHGTVSRTAQYPARHGIPHRTVSRTAQYPARHGTPHGMVSRTARYPARHGTKTLCTRRLLRTRVCDGWADTADFSMHSVSTLRGSGAPHGTQALRPGRGRVSTGTIGVTMSASQHSTTCCIRTGPKLHEPVGVSATSHHTLRFPDDSSCAIT